jgi:amidase
VKVHIMKTAARARSTPIESAFATASETVDAIRAKQISARELLDMTFQRIDRHNRAVNAIIWENREDAIARATRADDLLARGGDSGALHGVPVTIKEAFAYRGSPSTWGLPALKDAISPRTAVAVERLESAGAIVVGKTNVAVMLADWQSDNPVYGTTNNPWDVTRTAGGSTGGGAAAVATGLGCLTLGSDLSGSIRIPAHFCGVYGHKPSLDLVSTAGFQPGPWDGSPGPPMDLAVVGPLARSARDLALALAAIGGAHGDPANAWTWRMPPPRHTRLHEFRIGYVTDDDLAPIASDLAPLYGRTLAALSEAGARMERGWPPGVDPQAELGTYQYLLFAFVNALGPRKAAEDHQRWMQETQKRLRSRAAWQKYFDSHDVFLCPAGFTAAFPHDHGQPLERRVIDTPEGHRPYLSTPLWTIFATLAGIPATVAPIGRTAAGLPVGMQILAPMWEDGTSIEFAERLGEAIGGFASPPEENAPSPATIA